MPLVSKAEFARHMGVSRPTVYRWIKDGKLPVTKAGKLDLRVCEETALGFMRHPDPPTTTLRSEPAPPEPAAPPPEYDPADVEGSIARMLATPPPATADQSGLWRARNEWAKAQRDTLKYQRERGEMMERGQVTRETAEIAVTLRTRLMGLGVSVAGDDPALRVRIDDEVHTALTEACDALRALGGDAC